MPAIDHEGWKRVLPDLFDSEFYARWAPRFRLISRYFRTTLLHAERIPQRGGALLVGNHATWGIDSFALIPEIFAATGRPVRGLAEKLLFATGLSRGLFAAFGAVPGVPETAVQLLRAGELCLCYPGGDRDSFKPWWQRHRLLWERRSGYLRVALRAGIPILPVLGVGIDDALPVVGRDRIFGRRLLGGPRYDLPLLLPGPLPLPSRFVFEIGEPITLSMEDSPSDAAIDQHHARIWKTCQQQLDALAQRYPTPWRDRMARYAAELHGEP